MLISVPASAHDGVLPLADQLSFRETMLDQPPPSRGLIIGATIVGLRLDGPIQKFDPNDVRVVLGEHEFTNDLLCVRFISGTAAILRAHGTRVLPALVQSRFLKQKRPLLISSLNMTLPK